MDESAWWKEYARDPGIVVGGDEQLFLSLSRSTLLDTLPVQVERSLPLIALLIGEVISAQRSE